jgi:hypothetical protein
MVVFHVDDSDNCIYIASTICSDLRCCNVDQSLVLHHARTMCMCVCYYSRDASIRRDILLQDAPTTDPHLHLFTSQSGSRVYSLDQHLLLIDDAGSHFTFCYQYQSSSAYTHAAARES